MVLILISYGYGFWYLKIKKIKKNERSFWVLESTGAEIINDTEMVRCQVTNTSVNAVSELLHTFEWWYKIAVYLIFQKFIIFLHVSFMALNSNDFFFSLNLIKHWSDYLCKADRYTIMPYIQITTTQPKILCFFARYKFSEQQQQQQWHIRYIVINFSYVFLTIKSSRVIFILDTQQCVLV